VPTPCKWRKATHPGASARAPGRPGVVRDPGMCRRSYAREPGDLAIGRSATAARRAVADDARSRGVRLCHSSREADEQSGPNRSGAGGAKGRAERNASQHSTHRTQGRERVSQALERVRQAARQRKKEKFTALLHHISIDGLRMAFVALKRDAASGVDGLTWPTYEADLDKKPH
jgi:hypothetical protein